MELKEKKKVGATVGRSAAGPHTHTHTARLLNHAAYVLYHQRTYCIWWDLTGRTRVTMTRLPWQLSRDIRAKERKMVKSER
jgi:hypothetical protein